MGDAIQPTHNAALYRDCFAEERLKKRVRQYLRMARNKEVIIEFGREDLLEDFASLMRKTELRKSIRLRERDYFAKILAVYPQDSYIALARLDLLARQEHLWAEQKRLTKQSESASVASSSQKIGQDLMRIEKELAFIAEQIMKGQGNVSIAGTLTVNFAGASETLYGGMDATYKDYKAALLTWVEDAKYTFEGGVSWQNLGGVEPSLDGGLYLFKSRMNPVIEEYIGEFELPVRPMLAKMLQYVLCLRKKMREKS